MATTTIKIHGLDKLRRKLGNLEQMDGVRAAMRAAAIHVKGKISDYPPASEANRPGQLRWYERGYGPRWTRADGSVGGRQTSQVLGKQWKNMARDRGLTQIIRNDVTYGPFVQDADYQAAFHKRRRWSTTQQVVKDEEPTVVKFIQREVDRILEE